MAFSDTSARTREIYFQRLADMKPAERVRIAVSLWETAWSLQRAAIRARNPAADEASIAFEIAVGHFGPELARAAYQRG